MEGYNVYLNEEDETGYVESVFLCLSYDTMREALEAIQILEKVYGKGNFFVDENTMWR